MTTTKTEYDVVVKANLQDPSKLGDCKCMSPISAATIQSPFSRPSAPVNLCHVVFGSKAISSEQLAASLLLVAGPFCHRVLLFLETKQVPYKKTLIDVNNKPQW
jgi:hypothetical protein